MKVPLLSIVIVNYNVGALLLKCLESIFYVSSYKNLEVIVVDNASTDGYLTEIENNYSIKSIKNKTNLGFASANNQGISIADGEIILMLNPDTEIKENSIYELINFFITSSEACIAGPKLLNTDGSLQLSAWKLPTLYKGLLNALFINQKPDYRSEEIISVESLSGAALLFRKKDFENVGGLDENLFWYEDDDLCCRISKYTGKKAYYVPSSEIIHHISRSARQDYRIPIANQLISRIKFFRKHFSKIKYLIIIKITFIHIISHIIIFSILSLFTKNAFRKVKAYLFTYKKLIQYLLWGKKGIIIP